jgi:hypothetical protein
VAGSFEHGNETSGPISGGEYFEKLSDYHILEEDFAS